MAGRKNPRLENPGKPGAPEKVNWENVREDYIIQNLDPERQKPYSMGECAVKWGVNASHLRDKAARGKWREQLREQSKKRTEMAIDKTRKHYADLEAEIRERQAQYGRLLQAWGVKAIQEAMQEEKASAALSNRDATDAVVRGGAMERTARGMSERIEVRHDDVDTEAEYESPEAKIARHDHRRKLKARLTKQFESEMEAAAEAAEAVETKVVADES